MSSKVKKILEITELAFKELKTFSPIIQAKFLALFNILERDGFLKEPFAKRLTKEIFEVRVKHQGQWRGLYAYLSQNRVIILSAFHKKTAKTPLNELRKAEKRLRRHQ